MQLIGLSTIVIGLKLWFQYGNQVNAGVGIINDLLALDDGKLVAEVEAIFKKHGVDIESIMKNLNTALDPAVVVDNGGSDHDPIIDIVNNNTPNHGER